MDKESPAFRPDMLLCCLRLGIKKFRGWLCVGARYALRGEQKRLFHQRCAGFAHISSCRFPNGDLFRRYSKTPQGFQNVNTANPQHNSDYC